MISVKKDEALWEEAKKQACVKANLCKHSARKMQWATKYYKEHGGKYKGNKSRSNKLSAWGKERWRTHSGKSSRGRLRYLPAKAWSRLTKAQIKRTNDTKKKGYMQGMQWVKQPIDVSQIARQYRVAKKKTRSARRKQ
tara:strand:- start:10922 stop:11335 length:414 start_codon:yes stop_codon:yes gene_type:complete